MIKHLLRIDCNSSDFQCDQILPLLDSHKLFAAPRVRRWNVSGLERDPKQRQYMWYCQLVRVMGWGNLHMLLDTISKALRLDVWCNGVRDGGDLVAPASSSNNAWGSNPPASKRGKWVICTKGGGLATTSPTDHPST